MEVKRCYYFRYQSQPVNLVSVEDVNQWVENVTKGHIPNFLESIPHDVVLMLMNAVYFKGEPFHPKTLIIVTVKLKIKQQRFLKLRAWAFLSRRKSINSTSALKPKWFQV